MNLFYKCYCRVFQKSLKTASNFLNWKKPIMLKDFDEALNVLGKDNLFPIFLVTDKTVGKSDFFISFTKLMDDKKISHVIFNDISSEPDVKLVNAGVKVFKENKCKSVIAVGGGSVIDCAKAVAASVSSNKPIEKLKGLLKVKKNLPPFIALPTTSGTGSEVTVAAVISDKEKHEKYSVTDTKLIPRYVILEPKLTINLPPFVTAYSGMDALTHAVEAYIGGSNTTKTKEYAEKAVKLIKENLIEVYKNGGDLEKRKNMQFASYYAGLAFTRAYVGPCHAAAHALGAYYGIPHGIACAASLPLVLKKYGKSCYKKLANLADIINLKTAGESKTDKACAFINFIEELNVKLDIKTAFDCINVDDIPKMAKQAFKESNPLYPSPILFDKSDYEDVFNKLKGEPIQ